MFKVLIMNGNMQGEHQIIFEGDAASVLLPGDEGEFEILDFHKPIVSRLKKGYILVDNDKDYLIREGVAKFSQQKLVAMVEV